MSVKAVIDTNVLVSAYWTSSADSPPVRVYRDLGRNVRALLYAGVLAESVGPDADQFRNSRPHCRQRRNVATLLPGSRSAGSQG